MKTKPIIKKMAVAGGFLLTASAAMANASLTAASGAQSFTIGGPQYGATTLSESFTDGWTITVTTADVSGGSPTVIDLDESASGITSSPLTITFTDSTFGIGGPAVFSTTGSATSDLTISVKIDGGPTSILAPTKSSDGVSQYGTLVASIIPAPLGTYTETITITPSTLEAQQVSLDSGLTVTTVPDGSATLALLGSAFIGLAGVRSKFGSKA